MTEPKAFPQLRKDAWGETFSTGGMNLRDYFAGQALVGMFPYFPLNPKEWSDSTSISIANVAYNIADAMIEKSKLSRTNID